MKDFWIYNVLRLGMLLASFALVTAIWAAVNGGQVSMIGAVIVAFLISGVASYFLLNRQREKVAAALERKAKQRFKRVEED